MPDWINQLLCRFFDSHGLSINTHELMQQYARIDFFSQAVLELNFIPNDELLLFSLRLNYKADQSTLENILQMNSYQNQQPFYPTAHLFEGDIVLRVLLQREQLDVVGLEAMLNGMLRTKECIAER